MVSEIVTIEETVSTCSSSLPQNESESKMPEDETSGFLEDQSSEGIGDKNLNQIHKFMTSHKLVFTNEFHK